MSIARRWSKQKVKLGLAFIVAISSGSAAFASPPNLRLQVSDPTTVACPLIEKPYEVRDFAPNFQGRKDQNGLARPREESNAWTLFTATKISTDCASALKGVWVEPQLSRVATLSDRDLLNEFGFEPAIEANNRGVNLLEQSQDFASLQNALRLFQFAAGRGHAQAYANLALTHFALSNLEQSVFAARMGTLLKQDEAVMLMAYFKVEAIHVEKDLAYAQTLLKTLQAKGVDTSPVSSMDMSYQFFPAHWVALQKALQRVGLFDGKADGIFGEDSKQALTAFQEQEGLPVTTKLNLALLDRLGLLKDFNQEVEAQKYIYGKF